MNWLKLTQRILAVIAIFLIWIGVYLFTSKIATESSVRTILAPKNTVGIIHINTHEITKSLLFEFAFNNKDPRILKIISEYWQNLAQDSSKKQLPLDFNGDISLFKIPYQNDFIWLVSGNYLPVQHPYKPHLGFIKDQKYFWILNASESNYEVILKSIRQTPWCSKPLSNHPIQYQLMLKEHITNSYGLNLFKNQLSIHYKTTGKVVALNAAKGKKCFQITTFLNRGSFVPQKYQRFKKLIESLSGFSMNYYGAKFIDDDSGPSYVEPQFDLLLSFAKKTKRDDILPLIRELLWENVRLEDEFLFLNHSRFYFSSKNDSTIYLGKHKMSATPMNTPFVLSGNPEVLTAISDLGWKEGVLELIPEFKALKDFTQSIKLISTNSEGTSQNVTIDFKDGVNAQLESLLLILTLTNAYQF